ncbi:MAG: phage holin family protein [Patescibacteria group bacterium]|nr:phage holin family protein [Patescibacteria group bacterium]
MMALIWQIIGGTLGIFLAVRFVPGVDLEIILGESSFFGVEFTEKWQILFLVGAILGLINFFIKPILDKITSPLKIITLGLSSLILNMFLIWILDILFLELQIAGLIPLFFTTIIIWLISSLLGLRR